MEHSYNKPEIPGQTVCYKQEFVTTELFLMRYCSTWLRSLLCYVKKFVIEEFVIRVLHCTCFLTCPVLLSFLFMFIRISCFTLCFTSCSHLLLSCSLYIRTTGRCKVSKPVNRYSTFYFDRFVAKRSRPASRRKQAGR